MSFELEPPDRDTKAALDSIARSPAKRPAEARYVTFYSRQKENQLKSWGGLVTEVDESGKEVRRQVKGEGRPIFESVEYVRILTPGDKDTVIDRPVNKLDRYVWADRYRAFRNGQEQGGDGTPLSQLVSPERVRELEHFGLITIEMLADVPDSNLGRLGFHARSEREKARNYLAVMKGNAPVAELKAENEALKARLDALERLAAQTSTQSEPPTKQKR